MKLVATQLDRCFEVHPSSIEDERGRFIKTFNTDVFEELGLPIIWSEEYFSGSHKGVIRGMHFQMPPYDHEKLVYCVSGRVLDVVVDLRRNSSTFGRHIAIELDAKYGRGIMIPKGMAHGFLSLTDNVIMAYKVTTVYSPDHDAGISWNSFGMNWGLDSPILSLRDNSHPSISDFQSPF